MPQFCYDSAILLLMKAGVKGLHTYASRSIVTNKALNSLLGSRVTDEQPLRRDDGIFGCICQSCANDALGAKEKIQNKV